MAGVVPIFCETWSQLHWPVGPTYHEPSFDPDRDGHSRSWSVINSTTYRMAWLSSSRLLQDFSELLCRFATDWFFSEPSCGPSQPEDDAWTEELYERDGRLFDDQLFEIIGFEMVVVSEVEPQDFPGPGPISEDEFSELVASC